MLGIKGKRGQEEELGEKVKLMFYVHSYASSKSLIQP